MASMFDSADQILIESFIDYCWNQLLSNYTPKYFLDELEGMKNFHVDNGVYGLRSDVVSSRFYTLANLPADSQNIIAMLEQELEQDWPQWLKIVVNDIVKLLEKIVKGCDAYGVWGPRTKGGYLYSSRNLDWNKNTGIDKYKLVTFYHLDDAVLSNNYATIGFAYGLGALAGISDLGITVSEMNLDNDQVTFSGVPFPLRLRMVLEQSNDLKSANQTWYSTNNTNSFNFLVGSATDALKNPNTGAHAIETIMGYSSVYTANSPIEKNAKYYCAPKQCNWIDQTGWINIGNPISNAVFRSNHAFDPKIMLTQEPLFNNTVVRYNLMHDLFVGLENSSTLVDDTIAISIVATLGTKGDDYFSCDYTKFSGDNVMSISYAPGQRDSSAGHFYIAWEQGGDNWRPAACNPYVRIDFDKWLVRKY